MGTDAFVSPQPYPLNRYEEGWQKNPFTLKTAPVAIQKESFAKDLTLGSVYKFDDVTTVVVVNTKTRERKSLKENEASLTGMMIKSVHLETARKDTYVEIAQGTDTAILRYDESFLKQVGSHPAQAQPNPNGGGAPNPGIVNNAANNNGGVPNNGLPPLPIVPNTGNPPPSVNRPLMNNGNQPPAAGANIPAPVRRRLLTTPVPSN
jgi:hypothetical protein